MQDPFDQKKESILSEINETISLSKKDLSPKGSIDKHAIPIIQLINNHKHMVTTSSCSGRLSVYVEGVKDHARIGSKGNEGYWLFVTHDPEEVKNWYVDKFIFKTDTSAGEINETTRFILYKFEPLILHVKCRDLETANELYKTSMNCGFRESGIGINNIVAIRISIKLDIPIGYVGANGEMVCMVSESYLKVADQLSLDRFKENFKKLDQLYSAIESIKEVEVVHEETKVQRRERKIREGLARQKLAQLEL